MVGGINKLFCKGASGALVVGDITDLESIENTVNWKRQVGEHVSQQKNQFEYNGQSGDEDEDDEHTIPMLLVLNKYDLVEDLVNDGHDLEEFMTFDYLHKFAEEYGFIGAMCTSAKTGQGVTEAVACLVRHILLKELQREECLACDG